MSADPRDARDWEILTRAARGETPKHIAFCMNLPQRTVDYVLAADRREFPDEPLTVADAAPARDPDPARPDKAPC